jgi:aconitase B
MDANQTKVETGHKELLAKMEADKKAAQVKADADRVQMQERMQVHRRELKEMMKKMMNANHNETLACREMTEERLKEKKLTSPDRKPEAAQKTEVPAENATVMPVGEPRKKQRRDRKLAVEHRHHEPKDKWCTPGEIGFCLLEGFPPCNSGMAQEEHLQGKFDPKKVFTVKGSDSGKKDYPLCRTQT